MKRFSLLRKTDLCERFFRRTHAHLSLEIYGTIH